MIRTPPGFISMRAVATCADCAAQVVGGECDDGGAMSRESRAAFAILKDALRSAGWSQRSNGALICHRCSPPVKRLER